MKAINFIRITQISIIFCLAISGCVGVDSAYQDAIEINSIEGYWQYTRKHPLYFEKYSEIVDQRLLDIYYDQFMKNDHSKFNVLIYSYDQFIQKYPNNKYIEVARYRLAEIKRIEQEEFDIAIKNNKLDDLNTFVKNYPGTLHAIQIQARVDELIKIEQGKEQKDWEIAKAVNTITGYKSFIARYPESERRYGAMVRINKLNSHSKNRSLTPLHKAQNTYQVLELLENGADIDARDNEGNTPLHTIIRSTIHFNSKYVVSWKLLGKKPSIDLGLAIVPFQGQLPCGNNMMGGNYFAIKNYFSKLVRSSEYIVNKDEKDIDFVKRCESSDEVWLLEKDGTIYYRNKSESFRHKIEEEDTDTEMVQLLIDAGADLNALNDNGESPLDIAIRNKSNAYIEILKNNR
jgi:hypothetical protein